MIKVSRLASLKDIAQHANVSLTTVSLVLNGQGDAKKISQQTQEEVRRAARALNYIPNLAAQNLRRGQESTRPTIALFWANDIRTNLLSRFLRGINICTNRYQLDYNLVICSYMPGQLCRSSKLLDGSQFHGAIFANLAMEDLIFLERLDLKIPLALYNRISNQYYCVATDAYRMGTLVAEELFSKGRHQVGLIVSPATFDAVQQRSKALLDYFANHGCPVSHDRIITTEGKSMESGAKACETLLAGERIDGIFCSSDDLAVGALYTLRKQGIQVPEDIAVCSIGDGDPEISRYAYPALTNVMLPMEDMAVSCLKGVFDMLNHQIPEKMIHIFDTPLMVREST